MNVCKLIFACFLGITLSACSDSSDNKSSTQSDNMAPATNAPANQPQAQPGQHKLSPTQQAAIEAAKNMPRQGKVLEMMHAGNYTYMHVDAGTGNPMWIAASMMRVKPDQKVMWTDAAVMNNFSSKALHRTFDQILFVSNAKVVE